MIYKLNLIGSLLILLICLNQSNYLAATGWGCSAIWLVGLVYRK